MNKKGILPQGDWENYKRITWGFPGTNFAMRVCWAFMRVCKQLLPGGFKSTTKTVIKISFTYSWIADPNSGWNNGSWQILLRFYCTLKIMRMIAFQHFFFLFFSQTKYLYDSLHRNRIKFSKELISRDELSLTNPFGEACFCTCLCCTSVAQVVLPRGGQTV